MSEIILRQVHIELEPDVAELLEIPETVFVENHFMAENESHELIDECWCEPTCEVDSNGIECYYHNRMN